MQGLDLGLKDRYKSGLDLGMDDSFSDFLYKKKSKYKLKLKNKLRKLKRYKKLQENRGDDAKVIRVNDKINKLKSVGRIKFGKTSRDMSPRVRIPTSVLENRGKKLMSCKDKLRTMRLTLDGKEKFIKACEGKGDFTASLVKKKEKIAEILVANDIVKNERAMEKENSKRQAKEEEQTELSKPITETSGFNKMILPIIAGIGILVLIKMN